MAIKPPAGSSAPKKPPTKAPPVKTIVAKKGGTTSGSTGSENNAPAPSKPAPSSPSAPSARVIAAKKSGPGQANKKSLKPQTSEARGTGATKQESLLRNNVRSGATGRKLTGSVSLDSATRGKDKAYPSISAPGGTSGGGRRQPGTYSGDGGSRATRTSSNYTGGRASGGSYAGSGQPGRGSEQDATTRGSSGGSTFSLGGTPVPRPGTSAVRPDFIGGNEGAGGQSGGATNPLAAGALSGLEGMNLEEVLYGAKKKGRIRRTRGTE